MKVPFYRVNAFIDDDTCTNLIRGGNPAAIILLTDEQSSQITDNQLQSLAAELNLSETSYVTRTAFRNTYRLRWFTPVAEIALCGHATLGAAAALRSASWVGKDATITFLTLSGDLTVIPSSDSMLSMEFPALTEQQFLSEQLESDLLSALTIDTSSVKQVFQSKFDTVVEVSSQSEVIAVKPNLETLKKLPIPRGVIVCSISDEDDIYESTSFVSRFFAPAFEVNEDPVTGSAHCALVPMYIKNGESGLARQLSPRGGKIFVENRGESVILSGKYYVVVEGSVNL